MRTYKEKIRSKKSFLNYVLNLPITNNYIRKDYKKELKKLKKKGGGF